ncbi:MAG TPA: PQQ-like beta-propeller repeat protein [Bacteroidales bacterium]|jgi:outer membrane protein assembly factor BamB|nr:PQQ-binding-like beta-propeller repeat protein [Bacteroidales bacterium]OQB64993.1 MAG: Quinohemoprotein alcohol dehydrogenase ADH IIB precursor [Bacteroidetes bacterium ADurb.Bin145]HOU01607.1 PQQ-like beta-propeller repeat protein [Bacteroidales bacterium]HQG62438.1 PQQ-like beta-propeller repeat protein [Bacteroidales bacterium]HQK66949.1 PQQ-like beta-propeller repeat protein [Bacteroidales bacterium]
MKRIANLTILLVVVMISAVNAFSQDWSQFRGPGRDSKVTGFKAPAKWPAELTLKWKITVGTGDATPVLAGKNIFLHTRQGAEETVLCLDAATGKQIWRYSYAAPAVTGPASSHPGPRSTPVIGEGKIVTFGVSGITSCLDLTSGKLLWKKDENQGVPQFSTGMSPIIYKGSVILQTGGKDNGQVVAYDLNTGAEKWKYTSEGPAYASPSMMTIDKILQVVLFTEKSLISLDPSNGKFLWKIETPPMQRFYVSVSPYIDGNKIYYTGLGAGSKAVEISRQGDTYVSKELWSNPEVGAKWTTPILKDGYLYGFTDQRRIYCINAANGQTAWIDNATNSDFSTILDCGSVIIGFPSTGYLIVFKPDPKAYSEIVKYKVAETAVYAFPVITGNNIYVKDAESLMLYSIN